MTALRESSAKGLSPWSSSRTTLCTVRVRSLAQPSASFSQSSFRLMSPALAIFSLATDFSVNAVVELFSLRGVPRCDCCSGSDVWNLGLTYWAAFHLWQLANLQLTAAWVEHLRVTWLIALKTRGCVNVDLLSAHTRHRLHHPWLQLPASLPLSCIHWDLDLKMLNCSQVTWN